MKTINASIEFEDGEWWYKRPEGIRQRARIRDCETCGAKFATYPKGETRFCSKKCWRRSCNRCSKVFAPRTKRTVYCSHECQRGMGICEQCGKQYVYSHHGAKRFCSKACFYDHEAPVGGVIMDNSGYTITKVPAGTPGVKLAGRGRAQWMWTHRYVMQQKLGRPLLKHEKVHHKNGRRDDNHPDNLELWKKAHPSGVRSADYHCPGCRCFEGDHA